MKVVVLGRQSLDELETMVREKFQAVLNTGLSKPQFPSEPRAEQMSERDVLK